MTPHRSQRIACLVAHIGLSLALCGCPSHAEVKELAALRQVSTANCARLEKDQRSLCLEVTKHRLANYDAYAQRHGDFVEKLRTIHREKAGQLEAANAQKARSQPLRRIWSEERLIARLITDDLAEQQAVEARVARSATGTATAIRLQTTNKKYICKVRDVGRVDCTSLATLLATYDNEMGKLILSDIARLHQVFPLDSVKELLFECGPGKWLDTGLTNEQISKFSDFLTEQGADNMLDACSNFPDTSGAGNLGNLASAGGFSGVTGIDGLGLFSNCGLGMSLDTSGSGGLKEMTDKMLEQFEENCDNNSAFSEIMEGDGDEPDLVPIPTDTTTTDTVTDNGDGTETVTTTTTTGGTTTTSSYVRYRTSTPNGTTTKTVTDPSGNVKQETVTNPDGSSKSTTYNPAKNSRTTRWYQDGTLEYAERQKQQADGSWKTVNYKVDNKRWKRVKECDLEVCATCSAFQDTMREMKTQCANSGGRSFECQAFGNAIGCCSNPDAFVADPRLVMPNPEGSFACIGGADPASTEEACSTRCSVAYSEDCYANCMDLSSRKLRYEFSLLDVICIYANSEDCFSKPGGFQLPRIDSVDPAGRPGGGLPTPPYLLEAVKLLTLDLALETAIGVGPQAAMEHVLCAPEPGERSVNRPWSARGSIP